MYTQEEKDDQALALLELAGQLRPQLLRYAQCLLGTAGDKDDADELVQQAMLAGHDAVQRNGLQTDNPKAYLLKAVRTRFMDEMRRRGKQVSLPGWREEAAEGEEPHRIGRDTPDELVAEQSAATEPSALGARIEQHLRDTYPLPDRIALRLTAEGYSTHDISSMMERPQSTVCRRLRAMIDAVRLWAAPLVGNV